MSDNIKDQLASNINQVKETGSRRVSSIKKIISEAASQTFEELREGTSEIRGSALEAFRSSVSEIKDSEKVQSLGVAGKRAVANPRETVSALIENAKNQPIAEQFRDKAANLDSQLSDRYGESYDSLSQKRRDVVEWYSKTLANSDPDGVSPAEQYQARAHGRVSQAGGSVARKEQQIKDYFKTVFKRFNANR